MKRKLLLLMCLCLLAGINAYSQEYAEIDGIYYELSEDEATVIYNYNGEGYSGAVVIPSSVTYEEKTYNVTCIGDLAFAYCYDLTSITIPKSVTSISYDAFEGCLFQTSAFINNSALTSPYSWGAVLYDTKTDDGVYIKDGLIVKIRATSSAITIPDGVTGVGDGVVNDSSWDNNGVTSVIFHCEEIGSWLEDFVRQWYWYCDVNIKELVFGNEVKHCNARFNYCENLTTVTFHCEKIGDDWFANTSLQEVILGNEVKRIESGAFRGCQGLTSISIPENMEEMGGAFYECNNLTSVTFHCKEIRNWFYDGTPAITEITIGNEVTNIAEYAFYGMTGLTSITIPENVTSIGEDAFYGCYFKNDAFVNNSALTSEDNWGAKIYDVETEDGLLIGDNVIIGIRSLETTSVTIPENVTDIDRRFLDEWRYNGSLASVTIHCKEIGDDWFFGMSSLEEVVIGDEVTRIGSGAFSACENLATVSGGTNVASMGYGVFGYGDWATTPWLEGLTEGLAYLGKVAYRYIGEMPEGTEIVIQDGTLGIAGEAFAGCSGLASIIIPESVTNIGGLAFDGTAWYENQPDGLVYAGRVAYRYKGEMPVGTEIVIKEGTTGIAEYAFSDCIGMASVTIPESVTSIGDGAFYGCIFAPDAFINNSALAYNENWGAVIYDKEADGLVIKDNIVITYRGTATSVTIPEGVTGIGERAFYECSNLTSITIPEGVTSIGSSAFEGCSSLTSFIIPEGVTIIEDFVFYGCSSLTTVTIPNSVTYIGSAFRGCTSLEEIRCYAEKAPECYYIGIEKNQVVLFVPDNAVDEYVIHPEWREFKIATSTGIITCLELSSYMENDITSGTYDYILMWWDSFQEGWNTICLPFAFSDIESYFGEGAKAYDFYSFANGELGFSAVTSLAAGYPYVLYIPTQHYGYYMWKGVEIEEADTEAHYTNKEGAYFRGTYTDLWSSSEWPKDAETDVIYGVTNEGKIARAGRWANIRGFHAYFDIPAGIEVKAINFNDEADAISLTPAHTEEEGDLHIYNMAGQRIQKMQKGINIVNGKKILK